MIFVFYGFIVSEGRAGTLGRLNRCVAKAWIDGKWPWRLCKLKR